MQVSHRILSQIQVLIFEGPVGDYARQQQVYPLARQKDLVEVEELNVQADHVHAILSVPPKYAISDLMGFRKGKMALNLFHRYEKFGKQYWGRHLWSREYCVSTVGLDEEGSNLLLALCFSK